MLLNDKQQQHSLFWTLLLFAFCLPIFPRVATYSGLLGLLICLIRPAIYKRFNLRFMLEILAFATPLLIYFPALFLGEPIGGKVETKMGLFFLPFVFVLVDWSIKERLLPLLKAYFLGLIGACLYTLVAASYTWLVSGEQNFFYSKLGSFLHFHPTYFSLYLLIGVVLFLLAYRKEHWLTKVEKQIGWLSVVLFTVFILLLSSRSQWINYFVFVPFLLYPIAKDKFGTFKTISLGLVAVVLMVILLFQIPSTRKRLVDVFQGAPATSNTSKISNVRFQTWDASWSLFKEQPWTGVGVANLQVKQLETYEKLTYDRPLKERYNAHNQYLDLLAGAGWIPLFFWLFCLFWQPNGRSELKSFYWTLLALFLVSFITESMLETARGVMVFAFFIGLFLIINKKASDAV